MPQVTIQQSTYERLQRHARPFEDTTPDPVINRALDALEQLSAPPAASGEPVPEPERSVDPNELPSLTHAKVLDASIAGEPIARPKWNLLVDEMLRRAAKRLWTIERLRQVFPVNMVRGCKVDDGYRYLADIDISVQGQDANKACLAAVTGARALGVSLDIGFMWRPKAGAKFPGERARLRVGVSPATKEKHG